MSACKIPTRSKDVQLIEDHFGFYEDKITGQSIPVRSFTWTNNNKASVTAITYGATVTKILIPDKNGAPDDIVMGYDDMEGYRQPNNPYFGATVGRVCNRIGNGQFTLNGKVINVSRNFNNKHMLHGGFIGFDKVVWDYYIKNTKVTMTYLSKDGEEGFPGAVLTSVAFELMADNQFIITMKATSTKPTPVNLTNHSYFNLAGHGAGAVELKKHFVMINADSYTLTDDDSIPTGRIQSVANTIFDLQVPQKLGEVIEQVPDLGGYDNNFCVNRGINQDLGFVARVTHPPSGRVLEIYSDQPGVQFYTSNSLPEDSSRRHHCDSNCEADCGHECSKKGTYPNDMKTVTAAKGSRTESVPEVIGKDHISYKKHGALCLETQNYPDAMNHNNFPNSILNPGETYKHVVIYKFWLMRTP